MAVTVEPVRVSPFIKCCRWTFLVCGIFYGASQYARLSKKQKAIRDNFDADRPQREAKAAAERKRRAEEELESLSTILGGGKTA